MIKYILYLWQLPQNIIGLIIVLITKAHSMTHVNLGIKYYYSNKCSIQISLGYYIILSEVKNSVILRHEYGHQLQSMYLGPFYIIILLLLIISNSYKNLTHKDINWYYNLPLEKWADKLGNISRR
jgi:hypothetical protein